MATQAERSGQSARRLLDAAIALGSERGFDRTSVSDICRRAGYSRAMVNERYGSKAGLLRAMMSVRFESWMTPGPSDDRTGLERALAHVTAFENAAAEDPKTLRAFLVLCYETTGPIPDLAEWMNVALDRYRASVAERLRAGQADGSVRDDLEPDEAARDYTTYVLGCGLQWTLDPQRMDLASECPRLRERLRAAWQARDPA
jgi:AcrR family transcriptional regulator